MRLARYELTKYTLIFKHPLVFKKYTLDKRQGYILRIEDTHGKVSQGEISPLPGFSIETLDQAYHQTTTFLDKLLDKKLTDIPSTENLYPSVSFGLETVFFSFFHSVASLTPPLCSLLTGSFEQIVQKVKKHPNSAAYKLKLANFSAKESLLVIKTIKDIIKDRPLRLDFNQKWSVQDHLYLFKHYSKSSFAYLEEPVSSFDELLELGKKTDFSLALDETLQTISPEQLEKIPNLKALIIKPTLLGGYSKISKWINLARKNDLEIVFSSSFENKVGLKSIIQMANFFNKLKTPIGLDTYEFFTKQVSLASRS